MILHVSDVINKPASALQQKLIYNGCHTSDVLCWEIWHKKREFNVD